MSSEPIVHIARQLEEAFRAGAEPDFDLYKTKFLVLACDWLFSHGRVDAGEYAARGLRARYPSLEYARTMVEVLDSTAHGPSRLLEFSDDPQSEVQVVRRENCDSVLFVFCGRRNRAGLPLSLIHRWLGRQPTSLVYLRDFNDVAGGEGYPSLGNDRRSSVAALERLAAELGAGRVYMYGNSSGTFAALHYGLQLGALGVLCMAGPTNLTREFNSQMTAFKTPISEGFARVPEYMIDLRPLYAAADRPPKVLYVYSEGFHNDRLWAENFAGLPSVELVPVENFAQHNVVIPAVSRGFYQLLLQRLLSVGAIPDSTSSLSPSTNGGFVRSSLL